MRVAALATNLLINALPEHAVPFDTMALKSLDIFSVHGFPVGLVQCESNLFGISNGNGSNVGSGGWSNIVDKYDKAKQYCDSLSRCPENGRKFSFISKANGFGERFKRCWCSAS